MADGGITINTPDGIAFYRLAALKGALDLQKKGMKMSRGMSATQVGKRQYGLTKNTASGQFPIVAQQVEDILAFRACAPAMQDHLGMALTTLLNSIVDDGQKVTPQAIEKSIRGAIKVNLVTGAEADVLRALGRIWLFERAAQPGTRVVFR